MQEESATPDRCWRLTEEPFKLDSGGSLLLHVRETRGVHDIPTSFVCFKVNRRAGGLWTSSSSSSAVGQPSMREAFPYHAIPWAAPATDEGDALLCNTPVSYIHYLCGSPEWEREIGFLPHPEGLQKRQQEGKGKKAFVLMISCKVVLLSGRAWQALAWAEGREPTGLESDRDTSHMNALMNGSTDPAWRPSSPVGVRQGS